MDKCAICGNLFTRDEWDLRHSDVDGNELHEVCCERSGPCSQPQD